MKSNATAFLALFLIASSAHAGRDEALIRQTRKNQLAHDASEKASQARQNPQSTDTPAAAGAGASGH